MLSTFFGLIVRWPAGSSVRKMAFLPNLFDFTNSQTGIPHRIPLLPHQPISTYRFRLSCWGRHQRDHLSLKFHSGITKMR